MPQIEVTFDIDANGIVSVTAKDKATGKEQQIKIRGSGGLSDADIQRMVKEAEANSEADKKRCGFIEAKNHADAQLHSAQKTLAEHGAHITQPERSAIDAAMTAVRMAMEGTDAAALTQATGALGQAAIRRPRLPRGRSPAHLARMRGASQL